MFFNKVMVMCRPLVIQGFLGKRFCFLLNFFSGACLSIVFVIAK